GSLAGFLVPGRVDDGKQRLQSAEDLLNKSLLPSLSSKFQVRTWEFGHDATRVDSTTNLKADDNATRIGDSLKHIAAEAGSMPLGAIVLLTDGGDNTGGVDRATIAQLRQLRVPVHTIGFGPDHFDKDIEVEDVAVPARALASSRVSARVAFRQHGFSGEKVKLVVRENGRPLAQQEITLKPDVEQSEAIVFNTGPAGAHSFQIGIDPVASEENKQNNAMIRLINVTEKKMRILYFEGEPRWDFKFIRRAVTDTNDPSLELSTILRTTQNKTLTQFTGAALPHELENGFPTKPEDLFAYDGLIIGSVEASYFTPTQQQMIRDFADRRGGGVLFTAGRYSLNDGGYLNTPMAEMMPLRLSSEKTFVRNFAGAELTEAGRESVICRLEEGREANIARWKRMPQVANYATLGAPKPGAVVLMTVAEAGHRGVPLLAVENYGHGRTAILATEGTWRWKMLQDHSDMTDFTFWQQLMRWLVTETPGQVAASTPHQVLSDETQVPLRAVVRDKLFQPATGAAVQATIVQPDGASAVVEMKPDPLEPGTYTGDYTAEKPGSYVAEIVARESGGKTDLGRDTLTFRREDGVAENFGAAQNKELLQKLAADTNGSYYTPATAKRLGDEVAVSGAGITAHENLDIWDMPILFLLVVLIRGGEWLLRRKWGVV
ncbi:MAG: glutamine amidotransferase, partial [Terriglobia bacterium]